jgi:hypothetical protein
MIYNAPWTSLGVRVQFVEKHNGLNKTIAQKVKLILLDLETNLKQTNHYM